jgi:tripeptide aminopeptidase
MSIRSGAFCLSKLITQHSSLITSFYVFPAKPVRRRRSCAASRVGARAARVPVLRGARGEFDEEHAAIVRDARAAVRRSGARRVLREKFEACGLEGASIDAEGNCVALRRGRSERPLLVLSAHLDTVFPAGTDCTVRRELRGCMRAPGVADDGCGLAALVALARALEEFEIETEGSILFVGTVGEEGEGDLRGVRHLLTAGEWAGRADAFISIDGPGSSASRTPRSPRAATA